MSSTTINKRPKPDYNRIRSNAHWTRRNLDTKYFPNALALYDYHNHLQNCIDYPTIGFLARRQYMTKKTYDYPDQFWVNKKILEKEPEIIELKAQLDIRLKDLYPRTRRLRKYIINHDKVVLGTVKKHQKYSKLEKLFLHFLVH